VNRWRRVQAGRDSQAIADNQLGASFDVGPRHARRPASRRPVFARGSPELEFANQLLTLLFCQSLGTLQELRHRSRSRPGDYTAVVEDHGRHLPGVKQIALNRLIQRQRA
jgi:hypothetical protein